MLKIYFGNDEQRNKAIKKRLELLNLDYEGYEMEDLDLQILMNLFINVTDMFELLSPKLLKYKLDNKLKLTEFAYKILKDCENCLKLPIGLNNQTVYADMTVEELSIFLPKSYRKAERIRLSQKAEKMDQGCRFWNNMDRLRRQAELRWYEFNNLMFAHVSDDLGEIKKAKDRFFNYKQNNRIPPKEIVLQIAKILMVTEEDLYITSTVKLEKINP